MAFSASHDGTVRRCPGHKPIASFETISQTPSLHSQLFSGAKKKSPAIDLNSITRYKMSFMGIGDSRLGSLSRSCTPPSVAIPATALLQQVHDVRGPAQPTTGFARNLFPGDRLIYIHSQKEFDYDAFPPCSIPVGFATSHPSGGQTSGSNSLKLRVACARDPTTGGCEVWRDTRGPLTPTLAHGHGHGGRPIPSLLPWYRITGTTPPSSFQHERSKRRLHRGI